MSVNLPQLRAFLAVVDEGGFGAAAPVLGISQSAVSHAVAALERAVGGPVLHRGKQPQLTTLGSRLLEHARAAIAAASAITDLAAEHADRPSGTIRLAAPATVCQGLLPDLLARWRAEFPAVKVRVFEGEDEEILEWLDGHTIDMAVLINPERHSDGVEIGADAFYALVPRDHPLAEEEIIDVTDLDDDPFLMFASGCEVHVRDIFRQAGRHPRPTHRVRENGTLIAMVQAGVGVSVVPGLLAGLIDHRLVLVPLRQHRKRRLVLTGPGTGTWHPAVTALVDGLKTDSAAG